MMHNRRCVRALIGVAMLGLVGFFVGVQRAAAQEPAQPAQPAADAVQLNWLGGAAPGATEVVSWGVPWPMGKVRKGDSLAVRSADGKTLPAQTWPLAYWPDGSIKWSGHAITATAAMPGPMETWIGPSAAPATALSATSDDTGISIDTGTLQARILKKGSNLFESLTIGQRKVAQNGRLILTLEDRSQQDQGILREQSLISRVDRVTLEQAGPVRAVVKIEGTHVSTSDPQRTLLPFVVRFYFSAGSDAIRIVHSFIFDSNGANDFIKGVGLSFSVPFAEEMQNRHVRFVGDVNDGGGVWVQPVQMLPGYRTQTGRQIAELYQAHLDGKRVPNVQDLTEQSRNALQTVPVWNSLRLTQLGPDSFSIDKRTNEKSSWLHVNSGKRSNGMAVLADVSGGIAVGVKDFWQRYPASIEIDGGATDVGEMKIWLWSPNGDAMDMRHYDTTGHLLDVNYEDWKPGWDSPYGVAHTADLTLWAFSQIPSNEALVKMSQAAAAPPLLVCAPEYYHSVPVFGNWSLPDRSSPARKWIEDQLDYLFSFYHGQVEERHWYGFWDFGDIMHNYDFGRHEWRYDVGGWAWTNSELAPDMFLYYMFLRSGRPEIFRMAEAMTRHTSETDVHHIGVFAPLGSRHNVNHWGDGAKQPRISQVGFKRFYYYMTTDDRTGDLMHEQLDADIAYDRVRAMDPGHVALGVTGDATTPPAVRGSVPQVGAGGRGGAAFAARGARGGAATGPTTARRGLAGRAQQPQQARDPNDPARFSNVSFGLDWICYAINWTTEWERTGDPVWHDRVLAGMRNIVANNPGAAFGSGRYFDIIFGGAEDLFQMEPMYPDAPDFWSGWAKSAAAMAATGGNDMNAPRMAAYAAHVLKDPALGARTWDALIGNAQFRQPIAEPKLIDGPGVLNPRHDPVFLGASAGWQLHGPASIQWALNAIEALELAKEYLPAWEASH